MKRTCWPLLLACAAAGCVPSTRWMREDVHPVAVRGDRRLDHAKIWTHGGMVQWHTVLVTRDSISGIPDRLVTPGDSSRVALPVSAVDSLRVGYRKNGDNSAPWTIPLLILAIIL